jgi:N-acetyl sugar amidotransferase
MATDVIARDAGQPKRASDAPEFAPTPNRYRVCIRCVMDTTDPDITFNSDGVCSHCGMYDQMVARKALSSNDRAQELERIVAEIKAAGRGKDYDCILGVSGGVDSTYVAYVLKQLGLRVLAIHVDNGWNSELAVFNIERVLQVLDIDLHTEVLNWDEFRDIQVAFLKASVPDGEIPTDHAIFAVLSDAPSRFGCRYVVNGVNSTSEAILPTSWTYGVSDWRYIRSVHKQFGRIPLRTYPHFRRWFHYFRRIVLQHHTVALLDLIDYRKEDAKRLLEEKLGWRDYGGKHYESVYTRFFQGYILPRKFRIDKRRAHLSSLICAGQMTRAEAVSILNEPTYDPSMQATDCEYALKKLGLTNEEFDEILRASPRTYRDYPNSLKYFPMLRVLARMARRLRILRNS